LDAVVSALSNHANNRSRAARELGISRVTLYKKLHKYGLC
jgi:transcriptional regulator of acetoin/glycerol metabolism